MEDFPKSVTQHDDRTLKLEWRDGSNHFYDVVELKKNCGCAACVHEITGERIVDPASISEDLRPVKIQSLGHYAIQVQWADNSCVSIFTWDKLRELAKS